MKKVIGVLAAVVGLSGCVSGGTHDIDLGSTPPAVSVAAVGQLDGAWSGRAHKLMDRGTTCSDWLDIQLQVRAGAVQGRHTNPRGFGADWVGTINANGIMTVAVDNSATAGGTGSKAYRTTGGHLQPDGSIVGIYESMYPAQYKCRFKFTLARNS